MLANAFIRKYRNPHGHNHDRCHGHDHDAVGKETIYKVKGMTCNHCKANIEKGLNDLPNIVLAVVDLQAGTIVVRGTATEEDIKNVVEGLGFKME